MVRVSICDTPIDVPVADPPKAPDTDSEEQIGGKTQSGYVPNVIGRDKTGSVRDYQWGGVNAVDFAQSKPSPRRNLK